MDSLCGEGDMGAGGDKLGGDCGGKRGEKGQVRGKGKDDTERDAWGGRDDGEGGRGGGGEGGGEEGVSERRKDEGVEDGGGKQKREGENDEVGCKRKLKLAGLHQQDTHTHQTNTIAEPPSLAPELANSIRTSAIGM